MIVETRTMLRVRRVRLTVVAGPEQGRELVSERERIRIGSHPQSDLVLRDQTVSRTHAEIQLTERGYLLVDVESTNGTVLDGQRVERAYLAPGSNIKIGATILTFNAVDEEIPIEAGHEGRLGAMVGESLAMRQAFGLIQKIAPMDVTVLVTGETGTGKELVARALHDYSTRKDGPFVVLDCGAIPPNLIESEIFGHERGAFTGAEKARAGAFERADGGTIFLDELGELRLDLQPRLLRVLENREIRRVGGNKVREIDVRVIAATNRDLQKEIQASNFREDLFFRLSVINVAIPPLRERRGDIEVLARHFLESPRVIASRGRIDISDEALSALKTYDWPGNVRELLNVLERATTLNRGEIIGLEDLPERIVQVDTPEGPPIEGDVEAMPEVSFKEAKEALLEDFERDYIRNILKACGGNISEAARRSGLHRKSIERLAKKYDLDARSLGED
ncbi:MAG: sigma 54-dependent Fis family transcriptional regulator [Deltaproteobacteria bacterium]|nr:sigma 54-dependent Fis family transcriptional regulator [Deltaproteobacteria bacterium]